MYILTYVAGFLEELWCFWAGSERTERTISKFTSALCAAVVPNEQNEDALIHFQID